MSAPCSCRAVARPAGGGLHWLEIDLANRGAEPVEVATDEPFAAFGLRASGAGGTPVAVHVPALDIGVREVTLRVGPGETVRLPTPIRLRLAAGVEPAEDRFVWTVDHDPAGLTLVLDLGLPPPFDVACPVELA